MLKSWEQLEKECESNYFLSLKTPEFLPSSANTTLQDFLEKKEGGKAFNYTE